jgi:hypothetical protein
MHLHGSSMLQHYFKYFMGAYLPETYMGACISYINMIAMQMNWQNLNRKMDM